MTPDSYETTRYLVLDSVDSSADLLLSGIDDAHIPPSTTKNALLSSGVVLIWT